MGLANRFTGSLLLSTAALAVGIPSAFAQDHAGIVTSLEGVAMVSRIALPEGRPLQFKDDVFVRDRITTGDRSLVRVLLGGKATITARERSVLTITEAPGVSTVHLDEGRISVAVSKGLMKPGEVIQIKTPNAVSAIRGTVVVAEVFPGTTLRSTISVLRGLVEVTRLDTGHQVGKSVHVGAFQAVTVAGSRPLAQPSAISAADAQRLTADFRIVPRELTPGATAAAVELAKQHAMDDAKSSVSAGNVAGKPVTTASDKKQDGGDADRASSKDGANGAVGKGKGKGHKNESSNNAGVAYSGSDSGAGAGSNAVSGSPTAAAGSAAPGGAVANVTNSSSSSVPDVNLGGGAGKKNKK
jgi:FecR-like protein